MLDCNLLCSMLQSTILNDHNAEGYDLIRVVRLKLYLLGVITGDIASAGFLKGRTNFFHFMIMIQFQKC